MDFCVLKKRKKNFFFSKSLKNDFFSKRREKLAVFLT